MYHYASQVLLCLRPCHTNDGIQYDFICKTVLINITFFKKYDHVFSPVMGSRDNTFILPSRCRRFQEKSLWESGDP